MNKWLFGLCAVLLGAALAAADVEAARLGGSRSIGVQRNVTRTAPSSVPARPAQQAAPAQAPGAQNAPAPAAGSKWLPILGGLALGGVLGALFGGSGFGGALLLALLAIGGVLAFRAFADRKSVV